MPIENERKFILCLNTDEKVFSKAANFIKEMEQFYLISGKNQSLRCRKTSSFVDNQVTIEHTMTFKQEVGKKVVEVETHISERDYRMLKTKSQSILKKIRYCIESWEVDFFKTDKVTYFVQAEIEMPENQKKPKKIPKLIQEKLIHVVKRGDKRFTSRKLCDVKHAQKLLKTLKEK